MRVLVMVASKHGATEEIGHAIRDALAEEGLEAEFLALAEVSSVEGFDAVILGSGIYGGRWLKAAKDFVEANAEGLRARPVWIFSSGPLGEPLVPDGNPADAAPITEATAARGHHVFGGRLDKGGLSLVERAMVRAVHAPEGDYRPWEEIRRWSSEIAQALRSEWSAQVVR
jgi:menaquinone-dependent protoporphyrinogen oxidase